MRSILVSCVLTSLFCIDGAEILQPNSDRGRFTASSWPSRSVTGREDLETTQKWLEKKSKKRLSEVTALS